MKSAKKPGVILITAAVICLVTACGGKGTERETGFLKPVEEESSRRSENDVVQSTEPESTESESTKPESTEPESTKQESTELESTEPESTEESKEEENTENAQEPSKDVTPGNGSVDLSNVATETTALEPAALGQWIQSTAHSYDSEQEETIYWRIVDITSDCQEDIDRYHGEKNHFYVFEPLENEDFAYRIATYEVYYPEDFPAGDKKIFSPYITLHARSPKGGGIKYKGVAYIGLGSCYEIAEKQEVFAGDVYVGKVLYVMINDDVEYVFSYSHKNDEGEYIDDYAAIK